MTRRGRAWIILVAGEPVERIRAKRGGYPDIIARASGDRAVAWTAVDLRDETPLPSPSSLAGVVVTGSAASVTERTPWMLRAEAYLRALAASRVPTLGICFGHQLLGQALGGEVIRNPRGREIGTVDLEVVADDPLLAAARPPLLANTVHVDTVAVLPPGARVLGRTALEPHAVVRFAESAWGVQFHPEADAEILRDTIDVRRDLLAREGLDPDTLIARASDAAAGASTLLRFIEVASAAERAPVAESDAPAPAP
jgi:GMP synthase (glutamine-hydrolysing)